MNGTAIVENLEKALGHSSLESSIKSNKSLVDSLSSGENDGAMVVSILRCFRCAFDGYEYDAKSFKKALDDAISQADDELAQDIKEINDKCVAEKIDADDNFVNRKKSIEELRDQLEKEASDLEVSCSSERMAYEDKGYFARRQHKEDYDKHIADMRARIDQCKQQIDQSHSAEQAAKNYRDELLEKAEARRDEKREATQVEYANVCNRCRSLYQGRMEAVKSTAQSYMNDLYTASDHDRLYKKVASLTPDYAEFETGYAATFVAPAEIVLGTLVEKYASEMLTEEEVELLRGLSVPCITREQTEDSLSFTLSLPYIAKLEDGFELYLKPTSVYDEEVPYDQLMSMEPEEFDLVLNHQRELLHMCSDDDEWDNRAVRAILLRLLMAYPAGKLQLTLIDSLKNGISFSGIPDMVDKHHENVIGGGVFTEPEHIEQALRSLRLKMGSYGQSYGTDRAAYFARESVQAVVINDFPNGFTKRSLSDLARLMENAESFGMVFVIGMNPAYDSEFKDDANFQTILKRADKLRVEGFDIEHLKLVNTDDDYRLDFAFSDIPEIEANAQKIVRELRRGVMTSAARKESFFQLYPNISDQNTWRRASSLDGVNIALGISGASRVTQVIVGMPGANTMHHGLITGPTGAGKSTALHTMIMSVLLNYSPDEVRLVLIDFKEGTEFRSYAPYRIPNFASITTTTEPEFALAALKGVETLFKRRAEVMSDLIEYRKDNDVAIPQVLVLFDEVQALFADNVPQKIKDECLSILTLLVTQGRAMGIHVFLASQSFERVPCLAPLMSDMKIRLCLKDTDSGGILDNADALKDSSAGSAILNDAGGAEDKNELFQVCMLEDDERAELLEKLSQVYNAPEMVDRYMPFSQRLLFTNIEDDLHHAFNSFIAYGFLPEADAFAQKLCLGSILRLEGTGHPYEHTGEPFDVRLDAENLLLIGDDYAIANSLFTFTGLSCCLEALARQANFQDHVLIFDFSEGANTLDDNQPSSMGDKASFGNIATAFPGVVEHVPTIASGGRRSRRSRTQTGDVKASPLAEAVDRIYGELQLRKSQCASAPDPDSVEFSRITLLFYSVGMALQLISPEALAAGVGGLSQMDKLCTLLDEGPLYGISTVAWGQTGSSVERILNAGGTHPALGYFANRVVFGATEEEFQTIASCVRPPATPEGAAFFCASTNVRMYFRPFDTPSVAWVEQFRMAFDEAFDGGAAAIGATFDDAASEAAQY